MATKATATKKAATKSTAANSGSNAIERKALAMDNKSEGMRLLFDAKYTVARVKAVFGAPYGYVYGVALRHGVIATAANRRVAKVTPKTKARTATKVTKVAGTKATARSTKATTSATTRVAAKLAAKAPAKVSGRPTPARRAANRKSSGAAAQVSA